MSRGHRKMGNADVDVRTTASPRRFSRQVSRFLKQVKVCKGVGRSYCNGTTKTIHGWCRGCKRQFGLEIRMKREALDKKLYG